MDEPEIATREGVLTMLTAKARGVGQRRDRA